MRPSAPYFPVFELIMTNTENKTIKIEAQPAEKRS
jgi:hypothetical protein